MLRDILCGKVTEVGRRFRVCGWAHRRRDHGGVIFIDLRDRSGLLQVVADPQQDARLFAVAEKVRNEFVLQVSGVVRPRPPGTVNPNLETGQVELLAEELQILNAAVPPPFSPADEPPSEEVRLRHRIVDLRRESMQRNLRLRHNICKAARKFLDGENFTEVETPILTRATPEGARDFLSPSRMQPGEFYALPQSPQLFKQMLMAAGVDRYYQFARCFRDEDLRADRQPEFSQIDIEAAFAEEADIRKLSEGMICAVFREAADVSLPSPFPQIAWAETMRRFGTDRPDLRNPLELAELTDVAKRCEFKVFRAAADSTGGRVAALRVPGGADLSRKDIDGLTEFVGGFGAKGLAYIKYAGGELQSPIVKFLTEGERAEIASRAGAEDGDIVFFGAGREDVVNASLAGLRERLGAERNLLKGEWAPVWVVDFPLLEYDADARTWSARHHPFTAPREGDEAKIASAPGEAMARAYDMVLNGAEIGGGSVRAHRAEVLLGTLAALGMDEAAARGRFGFLLSALESGAPPHGGIAFGLDRIAAMLAGAASIREVIAFPKTQRGLCPLTGAPSAAGEGQLRELGLRLAEGTGGTGGMAGGSGKEG